MARLILVKGKELRNTHTMHLACFPMHQEEHVYPRVLHQWKCDQKSEVLSYNINQNVAVTENRTYCYENDGLLRERMGLASGKAEQSYFQGMMPVNWAILVWFPSLDVSLFQTKGTRGKTRTLSAPR